MASRRPGGLGESTAARILRIAEGNPLFVEELVAMLIDEAPVLADDGHLPEAVPPHDACSGRGAP